MSATRIWAWIRALLFRKRVESDMDQEMRLHLDLETASNIRAGMAPDVARRSALVAFQGVDRMKEEYRDALGTRIIGESWRDLRYAARLARRSPAFTIAALSLLALAVGTANAIFSVAYSVLVRPLPYPHSERLVFISEGGSGVAWPNYLDWRARATVFDGLGASLADAVIVTGGDAPERTEARSVTSNFLGVLGIAAFKGRLFDDADARPDAAPTAVVSHAFWMSKLGGSTAAIGRTLSLSRGSFTVIGVLPPGFRYMTTADVYLLLEPQVVQSNFHGMQDRNNQASLFAVGRLKPGVSIRAAQTEMHAIAAALAQEYPATNKGSDVPVVSLVDRIVGSTAPTLTVLAGAVALLLLIGCINLASLLVNRTASRAHELSVRAAIGGSWRRLVRQLVTEQALFLLAGSVLGAAAGAVILAGIVKMAPSDLPRLDEIHLNPGVVAWDDAHQLRLCIRVWYWANARGLGSPAWRPGLTIGPTLDAFHIGIAPRVDGRGNRRGDGATLRRRPHGAHDGSTGAGRSRL
jgi:putative ABC transport system permease protein